MRNRCLINSRDRVKFKQAMRIAKGTKSYGSYDIENIIRFVINHGEGYLHYLFSIGLNPDMRGYGGKTLLHHAIELGHSKLTKELVKLGMDIKEKDHRGWSCLYTAVKYGRDKIIPLLIELGCDPNEKSIFDHRYKKECSILSSAQYHWQTRCEKMLIKYGAIDE